MIADLKPYPEYKVSDQEWIGKVPAHWEVSPLGRLLAERKENNDPIKTNNILSLSLHDGVIPYADKRPGGNKAKEDLTAYKLAYPGDIVLNSMNVVVGSVGLSKYFGAVSPVYYMLYPRNACDLVNYFDAIFQHSIFQSSLFGLGNGILVIQSKSSGKLNTIRMRIPMTRLKLVLLPYPPPSEQVAIVRFLDWANGRLERAIRAKRKVIALLNEQKQAIIHRAVTRGLDPNVPLKPSGIPWLGDIPAHWEVGPGLLGFTEKQIKNVGMVEKRVLSLSYGRIVIKPVEKLHGLVPESFETYQIVSPGDIIIRPTDLQNDHTSLRVGLVQDRGIITSAYLCLVAKPRLTPEYAYQLLNTYDFNKVLYGLGSGMRQNLSFSDFKRLPLLIPPIGEQIMITQRIEEGLLAVAPAISRLEREIALLREYRTRLTADVVTGKLDVRDAMLLDEFPPNSETQGYNEAEFSGEVYGDND